MSQVIGEPLGRTQRVEFLREIKAVPIDAARYAVFLSVLRDEGKLTSSHDVDKDYDSEFDDVKVLTATNPEARRTRVPVLHGAHRITLLHQPDLIPLRVGENTGQTSVLTLGLNNTGKELTADAQGRDVVIYRDVDAIMNDADRISILKDTVFEEYKLSVGADLTARLGSVAAQMREIAEIAQRVGFVLPQNGELPPTS